VATLIDTSVFVAAERRKFDLAGWLETLPKETFAMSAMTLSELWFGVLRATKEHREAREAFVHDLADRFPVRPFDAFAAKAHAEAWSDLATRGQMIGAHDLVIAATALAGAMTLATLNLDHFRRVCGLKTIDPRA
jgi:tRNA(fMet)-specific endonuclease VapC